MSTTASIDLSKPVSIDLDQIDVEFAEQPEERKYPDDSDLRGSPVFANEASARYNRTPKCQGTRSDGEPCRALARKGYKFCKFHGGNTKKGALRSAFKHGRHSMVFPKHIAENYEKALEDPRLVELRADIATYEARIQDLATQLKAFRNVDFVRSCKSKLLVLYREVKATIEQPETTAEENLESLTRLKAEMFSHLEQKISEHIAWKEFEKATDMKRKLVTAEAKRLKDVGAVLNLDQTMALLASISYQVKQYLSSEDLLKFQKDMASMLNLTGANFGLIETKDLTGETIELIVDEADEGDMPYNIVEKKTLAPEKVVETPDDPQYTEANKIV